MGASLPQALRSRPARSHPPPKVARFTDALHGINGVAITLRWVAAWLYTPFSKVLP